MAEVFKPPQQPKHDVTQQAYLILKYAHDTAESLIEAFVKVREARKAMGTPRDEEQDLLRAMVVFAGAGLDALTKQLVRDALPVMVVELPEARRRLVKLGARHLSRGQEIELDDTSVGTINVQRLSQVLLASDTRSGMIEILIDDLTAGSLQSASELKRVAGYLGIDAKDLGASDKDLKDVFDVRNRLIHEMDIDFSQPNRNRFPRRRADMVKHASTLLRCGDSILMAVDSQLKK